MFGRSASARGAGASGSSAEGYGEYTLADGEGAAEGRPRVPPALPFCLRGVQLSPAGARRGAALPSVKEGAEGNDL